MTSNEIKQWQADLGLSEASMAHYLGVPVHTLRKWINGTRKPDAAPCRLFAILQMVQTLAPSMHDGLMHGASGALVTPEPAASTPQTAPVTRRKPGRPGRKAKAADAPAPDPVAPVAIPSWLTSASI